MTADLWASQTRHSRPAGILPGLCTGERPIATIWQLVHTLPNDSLAAAPPCRWRQLPKRSDCQQPEVLNERVEVALAEQQPVPTFNAECGNQAVDRLADGDAVATKRAEVAC
jgi:hypothetical protein